MEIGAQELSNEVSATINIGQLIHGRDHYMSSKGEMKMSLRLMILKVSATSSTSNGLCSVHSHDGGV